MRFIAAQRPSNDRDLIVRTLRWGIGVAIGLGLIWAVLIGFTRSWIANAFHVPVAMMPEAHDALLIFGIGVLLMFPTQALNAALQGFERLDLSNLSVILGVTTQTLALYIGLHAGAGQLAQLVLHERLRQLGVALQYVRDPGQAPRRSKRT